MLSVFDSCSLVLSACVQDQREGPLLNMVLAGRIQGVLASWGVGYRPSIASIGLSSSTSISLRAAQDHRYRDWRGQGGAG